MSKRYKSKSQRQMEREAMLKAAKFRREFRKTWGKELCASRLRLISAAALLICDRDGIPTSNITASMVRYTMPKWSWFDWDWLTFWALSPQRKWVDKYAAEAAHG
jgi:hypothetical protein